MYDADDDQSHVSAPQALTSSSKEKLRQFVARIETLETEKTELAEQLKEVYGEAKSLGFDTKALRAVIRLRKQDANDRAEAEMMLDLYLEAVGEI
ncbi:DUF2312 domain-containing protein [Aquidulcibacter sp.]|jgi:uncharacterized protein (UPF0335 family)|uniref:DUF2312 domain-containing protein n=1 Tax=Aquidulcibacter sp. TaxID=2052990 RepID=UPI00078D3ADE|nr:DUF2312 domain-containing protein [Aquidulcibacter sp.]AMS28718.1 hypothetical protein AEM38_03300 [Hyphomonadaceae bacterium UKL13-1]MCE2889879.1 DUF2312 domain-containing protein [Hyphomonadaceae bacterium]OYU51400.1 MAG: hypothetical protein CFE27_11470 [Alphaproteobacteria bacterium PA1]MCA3697592.1 DUF2312 domain-containing protein [Aquidulcibacter sp.]MCZ8208211.1 DUF2312 domain-containing protein [Aquidulcibacter sp.]